MSGYNNHMKQQQERLQSCKFCQKVFPFGSMYSHIRKEHQFKETHQYGISLRNMGTPCQKKGQDNLLTHWNSLNIA